jgi:hypothetical protein
LDKAFELEISNPKQEETRATARLILPATPYELADALDKIRIDVPRGICSLENVYCELEYLPQFINPDVNLYDLNHLAYRLYNLSEWELDCFEGMVMMDAVQTQYAPIPMERLINMTHSMDHCHIAYEAHNDTSLGMFYAENGFVPDLEALPENVFAWLDYGKIGKEMREGEGGVFTPNGYVVQNGEIGKVYQSGDAIPAEKPDYMVLLMVGNGFFSDPEYNGKLTGSLKLPASDEELRRLAEKMKASSPRECTFTAVDCVIPRLIDEITDLLEATNGHGYGVINELANQLQRLDGDGSLPTYKAMLEAAPKDISLEEALDLTFHTEGFILTREASSPADYARKELEKHGLPFIDDLLSRSHLAHYGTKLMEQGGATATDYGILFSRNGQTLEQCLGRPDIQMDMS